MVFITWGCLGENLFLTLITCGFKPGYCYRGGIDDIVYLDEHEAWLCHDAVIPCDVQHPYVILSVLPKLRQMNRHMAERRWIGATRYMRCARLSFRKSCRGDHRCTDGFTLSIDDFVISFFNGIRVTNLHVIYPWEEGIKPSINAEHADAFDSGNIAADH